MTPAIQGLWNPNLNSLSSLFLLGPAGADTDGDNDKSGRSGASGQTNGPAATLNLSPAGQLFGGQGQSLRNLALNAAAGVLNLSVSALQADLASGQTLQQIAQKQGVDYAKVQAAIRSAVQPQLDQAVANGQINSQQEQNILSRLTSLGGHHHHAHGAGSGEQYSLSDITLQGSGATGGSSASGVSGLFGLSDSNSPASMTTRAS